MLHMTQQAGGFSYGRNFRRPDTQVLFALRFADGTTAYTRVQPRLATYGTSPAVTRLVKERQMTGEVPGGDIVAIIRVK
jgi:hypothetical protein